MIGAWIRNVVLVLILAAWIYLGVDINARLLAVTSHFQSAEQIVFFLVVPAIVIGVSLLALVLRWRRSFAGGDAILAGWPILFLPIYLLPLQ